MSSTLPLWAAMLLSSPVATAGHDPGAIAGLVRDTGAQPLRGALVVAHCDCLERAREVQTDDFGRFRLEGLPLGEYTVQVLFGAADVSQRVSLGVAIRHALQFRVDTRADARRGSP